MTEIIYKDLSYKIMGVVFRAYNDLGYGYQEKYYQKVIGLEFDEEGIKYKKEQLIHLTYKNQNIGKYFIDFVVEDKIVLELKVGSCFYKRDIKQILSYLKSTNLQLGILILITPKEIRYKRILNINS